jgi:hypothetical protein
MTDLTSLILAEGNRETRFPVRLTDVRRFPRWLGEPIYQLNWDPKPRRSEPRRTQNRRSRDPSGPFPAVDIPGMCGASPFSSEIGHFGR